jgi:hypothetical protein
MLPPGRETRAGQVACPEEETMAIGLQTFDANGVLILDATHRIGKIIATFDTGIANSSRVVSELQDAGTPFSYITTDEDYFTEHYAYPDIQITGNTVSWTFNDYKIPYHPYNQAPRKSVEISVGVF